MRPQANVNQTWVTKCGSMKNNLIHVKEEKSEFIDQLASMVR